MQNEKRLIDANALMKAIKGFRWFGGMPPNTLGLMFDNLRIIIKGQPTVDAVEAVHGRWEHRIPDHEVPWYWVNECSNCGFRGEILYNYCPNCGAKMDGERRADTREKLIKIVKEKEAWLPNVGTLATQTLRFVDHLIANGVRLESSLEKKQATSEESERWIPVTERLPALIPCEAGTAYSEAVNILTSGRKVLTAIWNGTDFIADAEFWEAEGEAITHWTPVPLPLPEPQKEE